MSSAESKINLTLNGITGAKKLIFLIGQSFAKSNLQNFQNLENLAQMDY